MMPFVIITALCPYQEEGDGDGPVAERTEHAVTLVVKDRTCRAAAHVQVNEGHSCRRLIAAAATQPRDDMAMHCHSGNMLCQQHAFACCWHSLWVTGCT